MKLLSFYLPQFHEIEENNRAWGKGFTEWDNVKKAIPLFKGHNQPRCPYDNNYYNLLDKSTLKWQIGLAEKYGIYGFCFYHYWFKDGKKVLEKPTEILLEDKSLDIPFCFSWANEPWTKTWHGAGGEKEILLEQKYGTQEQWKEHFDYLSSFFKDERYIKIDNKPVFLFYQSRKIGCFNDMIDYWNELAKDNGFNGLYIIHMLTGDGKENRNRRVQATVDFEPGKDARKRIKSRDGDDVLSVQSYDEVCIEMLSKVHKKNEFRCMFVDYDDTPRRGAHGIVYRGSCPDKFGMYLQKMIELSEQDGNEFVFINAWNEWGESNYLEPDCKYEHQYLEAVKNALNQVYQYDFNLKITGKNEKETNKFKAYYELCNIWMKRIYEGCQVGQFFMEKHYRRIAIYGMGELGARLIESLTGSSITVCYGIDSNVWGAYGELEIYSLDEIQSISDVDCVVVTPVHAFTEIVLQIRDKCNCDIISLEDVIYGL